MQVEETCDLLLARTRLSADHHRLSGPGKGLDLTSQRSHCTADAVEAVHQQVFTFSPVHGSEAGPVGVKGDSGRGTVEEAVASHIDQQRLGGDAVKLIPLCVIKTQRTAGRHLFKVGPQNV